MVELNKSTEIYCNASVANNRAFFSVLIFSRGHFVKEIINPVNTQNSCEAELIGVIKALEACKELLDEIEKPITLYTNMQFIESIPSMNNRRTSKHQYPKLTRKVQSLIEELDIKIKHTKSLSSEVTPMTMCDITSRCLCYTDLFQKVNRS